VAEPRSLEQAGHLQKASHNQPLQRMTRSHAERRALPPGRRWATVIRLRRRPESGIGWVSEAQPTSISVPRGLRIADAPYQRRSPTDLWVMQSASRGNAVFHALRRGREPRQKRTTVAVMGRLRRRRPGGLRSPGRALWVAGVSSRPRFAGPLIQGLEDSTPATQDSPLRARRRSFTYFAIVLRRRQGQVAGVWRS
jgi:hypothetical protein